MSRAILHDILTYFCCKHMYLYLSVGLTSQMAVTPTGGPVTYTRLACDFETTAICGYQNERGTDDFDWTRNAGSTRSNGTGPFADHTLGTTAGLKWNNIFIYIRKEFLLFFFSFSVCTMSLGEFFTIDLLYYIFYIWTILQFQMKLALKQFSKNDKSLEIQESDLEVGLKMCRAKEKLSFQVKFIWFFFRFFFL